MIGKVKLPVTIENFEDMRTGNYYYVDKTYFIEELLNDGASINLFTRPRRFGKTLTMSMLEHFFDIRKDSKTLFEGLYILKNENLCNNWMNQYPVVFLTFKDIARMEFEKSYKQLCEIISNLYNKHEYLLNSNHVNDIDKARFLRLRNCNGANSDIENSLKTLSRMLYHHYNKKVILLIDEYDVPLAKSYDYGYYNEMLDTIRGILSISLKTNEYLKLAVVTGCLRISKESIFTGLNNLKVNSITDARYDDAFGFTNDEVKKILSYYELSNKYDLIKEWYDGYHFGKTNVYCPWDLLNYCNEVIYDEDLQPQSYWIHTSSNSIVRNLIRKATKKTQSEIEKLTSGESIWKKIRQELTYNEINDSIDNLWSVLFTTGYLTQIGVRNRNEYQLVIPNKEIYYIFEEEIKSWFDDMVKNDIIPLKVFCNAFVKKDVQAIEESFNAFLSKTISIRDTYVAIAKKENFYHGILLGLFAHNEDWIVSSNVESGDGYSDILIQTENNIGIIIEIKYGEDKKLDEACDEALKQIETMNYAQKLINDGVDTIYKYGIGCFKKICKVKLAK